MYVDTKTAEVLRPRTLADRLKEFKRRQRIRVRYLAHIPTSAVVPWARPIDYHYLGHHKCATHWIRKFLFYLAPIVQANYVVHGGVAHRQFTAWWLRRTFHLHVNAERETFLSVPEADRGFHVVRDPRDALISDYFSRRDAHPIHNPWNEALRRYLTTHSKEDGLIHLLDQTPYFQQMEGWEVGSRPNILDVKYEDLVADQFGSFRRIVDHLGIDIGDAKLGQIVDLCAFRNMARGRAQGHEETKSQYRKGVAGDWRNHMPEGSRVYEAFSARWSDLVARLGYDP